MPSFNLFVTFFYGGKIVGRPSVSGQTWWRKRRGRSGFLNFGFFVNFLEHGLDGPGAESLKGERKV